MKSIDFHKLYGLLDKVTPLLTDCGILCGKKCCTQWQQGVGVYLLPGEKELFLDKTWCKVIDLQPEQQVFNGQNTGLLHCEGHCPREKRPLLCRTFPLAVLMDAKGELEICLDDDGVLVCPLVRQGDMKLLQQDFIKSVHMVWKELALQEPIQHYLHQYTQRILAQREEPWRKLF